MRNYRAGLAAAAIYNANRKKGAKPISSLDFFEDSEVKSGAVKSAAQCLMQFERATKALNKKGTRG